MWSVGTIIALRDHVRCASAYILPTGRDMFPVIKQHCLQWPLATAAQSDLQLSPGCCAHVRSFFIVSTPHMAAGLGQVGTKIAVVRCYNTCQDLQSRMFLKCVKCLHWVFCSPHCPQDPNSCKAQVTHHLQFIRRDAAQCIHRHLCLV